MKIVIAGAGAVGIHLARLLSNEAQEITIIEIKKTQVDYAKNHLDVAVVEGNITLISTLITANVAEADLFIAATSSESSNIITSIIAKNLGARRVITRVSSTDYIDYKHEFDLNKLGIDTFVVPELLAAKEIQRLLKNVVFTDIFKFNTGNLKVVGVHITKESTFIDKTITQISDKVKSNFYVTLAIQRDDETLIPSHGTTFIVGDHAYFLATEEGIERLIECSSIEKREVKNVMILGGSRVGINIIKLLKSDYNIKLIERDSDIAFQLADELKNVTVLQGDGRSIEFMKENGLEEVDAFISVTGRTETNIITSLSAKKLGISKTIALVENVDYLSLSQSIGIDTMINKKLIAANFIFRYVRKGEVVSLTTLHGVDVEILEFIVKEKSKINNKKSTDIILPKDAILGGVIRNEIGYIDLADLKFQVDDHVIVLTRPFCVHIVESFFS